MDGDVASECCQFLLRAFYCFGCLDYQNYFLQWQEFCLTLEMSRWIQGKAAENAMKKCRITGQGKANKMATK